MADDIDGAAGNNDGNLPEQSAEEWATYRQRLEEAAETAHRAEARPQPSPESMSRPRMHLLEMRAVHEPENVAERIQN
jgi:hypothetical protein